METYSENIKNKKEAKAYEEEIRNLRNKVFSLALEALGRQNRGRWFLNKQVEFYNKVAPEYTEKMFSLSYSNWKFYR